MSRNSKSARRVLARKAITAMHKNGEKGAAKTTPKHGKVNRLPRNKITARVDNNPTNP